MPIIYAVIHAYNAGAQLPALLKGLRNQTVSSSARSRQGTVGCARSDAAVFGWADTGQACRVWWR